MTTKPPGTLSARIAARTNSASRAIVAAEKKTRNDKTARLRKARLKREAQLDEALKESFPASDPVELGHSDHVGRPKNRKT
jgi:hypothetical protein